MLTAGPVFYDPAGLLTEGRAALRWYPDDVWRYVLAAGWLRIDQDEPFVGRTGGSGDDIGSQVIAARIVREQIKLAFLLERRWAPYSKWLGRAFAELTVAPRLSPLLRAALSADGWRSREQSLVTASCVLAETTNQLGLAEPVDIGAHQFFDRDIQVSAAEHLVTALVGSVTDPRVRQLIDGLGGRLDGMPALPGSLDQAVDSVDILTSSRRRRGAGPVLGLSTGGDEPS